MYVRRSFVLFYDFMLMRNVNFALYTFYNFILFYGSENYEF